ncbi:DUF3300 domain-containing protein [Alteromonas flava]|uniref:DUF3300 domain-containing protein n=1 Tax=Alteromonas flava TaxID=2048003 RepID=UPI000C28969D|nr:DUF3300 domain-containing protein [Alteromonas flava]
MKSTQRIALIYAIALILSISLAIQFASAREYDNGEYSSSVLNEEQLDTVLAPIALYPDTLLTHVLIASTYPMDVIRAARWREDNQHLSEDQIRERVDVFDWDPSVKALTPFDRVLTQMSEDIDWLNYLGDAVIADEEWVMSRIQALREIAYRKGNLQSNDYVSVAREDDVVVIETVRDRVVYVPYYDTRVVYGNWWHARSPYYWHHPRHYHWNAGFYWSPSIHIASHFFFGGFHWHHGYVVINTTPHYRPYYRDHKRVYTREYKRWAHNTQHRRARYHERVVRHREYRQREPLKVVRNREVVNTRYGEYQRAAPVKLEQRVRHVKSVQSRTSKPVTTTSRNVSKVRTETPRQHRDVVTTPKRERVEVPRPTQHRQPSKHQRAVVQPRVEQRNYAPPQRVNKQQPALKVPRETPRASRDVQRAQPKARQPVSRDRAPQQVKRHSRENRQK